MYTEIQIRIKPEQAGVEETLRQIAARVAGVGAERICRVDIVRKSIDARQKEVMFNLVAGLHIDRIEEKEKVFVPAYRDVSDGETVVVVGAGPVSYTHLDNGGKRITAAEAVKGLKPFVKE